MKRSMTDRYEDELKDPALTAMLRAAFADDPALAESPGRTERVMRRVLASGVRPVWQRARWAPFGWAFGSLATAAAVLVLLLRLMTQQAGQQVVKHPVPPQPAPKLARKMPAPPDDIIPVKAPSIPATVEHPQVAWNNHHEAAPEITETVSEVRNTAVVADVDTPANTAATLYSAGTSASVAGDYETAFAAYQASYETSPSPEALLASAETLERMNQEYFTPEG